MNTAPPAAEPASPPDPPDTRTVGEIYAATPNVAYLFGMLIVVRQAGLALFHRLRQPGAVPDERLTRYYRSPDMPVIIRYLLRGLMRAEALMIVLSRRGKRGKDVKEWAPRKPSSRTPGEDRKRDPHRTPRPPHPDDDVPFAERLPTRQELLAWARGRSMGAALKAICLDLGVLRDDLHPEHWREMERTISRFAANAAKLFLGIRDRLLPLSDAAPQKRQRRRGSAAPPPEPAAPVTPRVMTPIRDLLEPLLHPPRRRTTAFA